MCLDKLTRVFTPKKPLIGYKAFRRDPQTGDLFSVCFGYNQRRQIGKWLKATQYEICSNEFDHDPENYGWKVQKRYKSGWHAYTNKKARGLVEWKLIHLHGEYYGESIVIHRVLLRGPMTKGKEEDDNVLVAPEMKILEEVKI